MISYIFGWVALVSLESLIILFCIGTDDKIKTAHYKLSNVLVIISFILSIVCSVSTAIWLKF